MVRLTGVANSLPADLVGYGRKTSKSLPKHGSDLPLCCVLAAGRAIDCGSAHPLLVSGVGCPAGGCRASSGVFHPPGAYFGEVSDPYGHAQQPEPPRR
jgi:hypothetical protein